MSKLVTLPALDLRSMIFHRTLEDKAFFSGLIMNASVGNYSHVQFLNPTGSGKTAYFWSIIPQPHASIGRVIRSYDTALTTNTAAIANLKRGGTRNPVVQARTQDNATQLGTAIATFRVDEPILTDCLLILPPGKAFTCTTDIQNTTCDMIGLWWED